MELIVYHGSNVLVKYPDIEHSQGVNRDFGTGFYVTNDFQAAQEYAFGRAEMRGGQPIITSYVLDLDILNDWGCVYLGDSPTLEWFEVVKQFRQFDEPLPKYAQAHAYIGLIADFRAAEVFESYFHGELSDESALDLLFKIILQPQICLKSNEVIQDALTYMPDEEFEAGIW